MVIVEFSGGLGNQMFQYALYLKLKELRKDVKCDTSLYDFNDSIRSFELTKAFAIVPDTISRKEGADIRGYGPDDSILDKVRHKVFKSRINTYRDDIDSFQPEIFEMDNVMLSGYWQNPGYFDDIRETVGEAYSFINISDKNIVLGKEMKNSNSVSIHIRRSDYLSFENEAIYGKICTVDYYKNAVSLVKEKVDDPVFYVFSDDPVWARENICESDVIMIEGNEGDSSYQDMFLMSQCRHHIIANSSFSWWGAYLGRNDKGITICPFRWFNNH